MRRFFLIFPLFLLGGCVSLDSRVTLGPDHIGNSVVDVDMTTLVSLVPELADVTSDDYMKKNLCEDINFIETIEDEWEEFMNKKCTSLGEYKARITSQIDFQNQEGILFLSGVIIIDMLNIGEYDTLIYPRSQLPERDGQDLSNISITQMYSLPGTIVYHEASKRLSANSIQIDLLDNRITDRRSAFVIATLNGKKLTIREINAYKAKFRKEMKKFD